MSKLFVRPYRPEDLAKLELQDVQKGEIDDIADPLGLVSQGEAWTLIAGERGKPETQTVRACAGLLFFSRTRARAWALMGRGLTKREWAVAVQRMGARLTEVQENKNLLRVEAETRIDFAPGHRLLLRLGFKFEAVSHAAAFDGTAVGTFVRLRNRVTAEEFRRYEAVRALGYSMVIEDVLERRWQRRAAA